MTRFLLLIFLIRVVSLPVSAQETRGTIQGHVSDSAGGSIAGVQVRAKNTATGVELTATTNEAGNYTLPYMLAGVYTLEAQASGFKKSIREGIELRINDRVEVNFELQVGQTTESIEVSADPPLLDTATSSLGQVVDQRRVLDLPTFGGSVMVLVQLAPGVINTTDMRLAKSGSFSINKNSQIATDGAGVYNNEFTLDGVSNTQAENGSIRVGFIPPAAAVAEFKVQTAAFDASAGHSVGSVINVSTKSGTNQLHGQADSALRNSAFDAPNIFQNRAGQKIPHYTDNRWGLVNLGQSVTVYPIERRRAYVQRWSFGVQQELKGQFVLEATYVGNRGTRLGVAHQLNNTPAQYVSTSPTRDTQTINSLSQSFPNPFFGTNPIYTANITRANLLRPWPQFTGVTLEEPVGYSWYHALQTKIEKRFSHDYTFQLSYTWSKAMQATEFLNPTDPAPYRTISDLDRTHHLVITGIWDLPFGSGKRFGAHMPKALDLIAGGWQLNGVVQRQSGAPLAFGDVWTLFMGNPDDVVLPKDQRSADRWFNVDAGFNRNSAQALGSNIRVSPLRFSGVRADGQARWDFSLIKKFSIYERIQMQYRAECINAFNHPNLFAPNINPANSAFGTITGQDVPRLWQMSLTLKF